MQNVLTAVQTYAKLFMNLVVLSDAINVVHYITRNVLNIMEENAEVQVVNSERHERNVCKQVVNRWKGL